MSKAVLFSDITIVSPHDDAPVSVIEHGYCAVADKKILYVGNSKDAAVIALKECAGENFFTYEGENKILCPTFANSHAHSPMTSGLAFR